MNADRTDSNWTPIETRCLIASWYLSIFACAVGVAGLVGWWRGIAVFYTFSASRVPINPVTALCLILCGLSVILSHSSERPYWSTVPAWLLAAVLFFGIGRVISLLSGSDFGLDLILFRQKIEAVHSLYRGHMSIEVAVVFVLFGSAMFSLNSSSRRLWKLSEGLFVACLILASVALTEYIYGSNLATMSRFRYTMALPTVIAFFAVSLAALLSRPRRTEAIKLLASETNGGRSARRLLPAAIILLFALAYFPYLGVRKGSYGVNLAFSIQTIASWIAVVAAILWHAKSLREHDATIASANRGLEEKIHEQTLELTNTNSHLNKLNRFYSELSKVNQMIVRTRDRDQLLSAACEIAVKDGLFQAAWIFLTEDGSQRIKPVAWAGVDDAYIEMIYRAGVEVIEGPGPMAAACRENRQIVINDVVTDRMMAPWRSEALLRGYRSHAACPLREGERVVGAMGFYSDEPRFFQPDELLVLEDLVGNVSYALSAIAQEKSLEESEQRFRALFEGATDGIALVDLETRRVSMANPRLLAMLGYSLEELRQRTIWDLHPPEYLPVLRKAFPTVANGQFGVPVELGVLRKDGSVFQAEVNGKVIEVGKQKMVVDLFRDITERRKAEQHIRILSQAVEHSPSLVILTDAEARIVYVNAKFTEVTGYSREEVVGQNPRVLKGGEVSPETYEKLWQTLTSGGVWRGEFHNRTKNGEYYWAVAAITALRNDAGEITHYLGMQEGITDRKRMEAERRVLEEQFRQAQKMEAVGRLAGGVAHDFNNLLGVISGYSELLLEDIHDFKLRQQIEEIQKAGYRATALTRQLLAFSRKQILEPKLLDLNSIVSDMGKMLKRLIGEDVKVVLVAAPNLGVIKADPGQIEQIILNLVVNSRDAMPHGGQLTIETANTELDERNARANVGVVPGKYVMLTIGDTGIGMDSETLLHMFEPFFTTKKLGTGLGLATVYGIVKQSGGHIWVYSEPGRGTTTKVYLPRVDVESAVTAGTLPQKTAQGGAEMILLVEDSQSLRTVAREFLVRAGYSVLEASDGNEAVREATLRKAPIHLLLTDVVMPGMSGRVVAEQVTSLHAETKVLYTSGYTDDAIIHYGVLEEGVALLPKPFTRETLIRKVRQVLDS